MLTPILVESIVRKAQTVRGRLETGNKTVCVYKHCSKCPFVYVVFFRKGTNCIQQSCWFQDIRHYIHIAWGLFLPVFVCPLSKAHLLKFWLLHREHQIRVLLLCAFFVRLPNTTHLSFGHSWKMCCGPAYEEHRSLNEDFKSDVKCRRETS